MSLSRNSVQRAGDRAFFISREIASGSRPQCLREQIHYEIVWPNNIQKLVI